MRFFALLLILLCIAMPLGSSQSTAEATTAITLPVDSVTIYPDGMMAVKRTGSLEVTEGTHKFVVDVPKAADQSSVLLAVSNSITEKVIYDGNPVYTLNVKKPGSQDFSLSYLMYGAGSWEPRYDLHLGDESLLINANAIVNNRGGEDLKNVRLKLVAGLPVEILPLYAKAAPQIQQRYAEAASEAALDLAAAPPEPASGELETLYIFELDGRRDLVMNKDIGFPLFQVESPMRRIYTWDASMKEDGPSVEVIRANNTLSSPWPSGKALVYRNDEYVSSIEIPYTPAGTNASIVIGPSADLKVEKKLKDYNITESIIVVNANGRNHSAKETIQSWSYHLKVESNMDRLAEVEVTDTMPQEGEIVATSPEPSEKTAMNLKWKMSLAPRQKAAIDYVYIVKSMETIGETI